jgi:hypothetical protein
VSVGAGAGVGAGVAGPGVLVGFGVIRGVGVGVGVAPGFAVPVGGSVLTGIGVGVASMSRLGSMIGPNVEPAGGGDPEAALEPTTTPLGRSEAELDAGPGVPGRSSCAASSASKIPIRIVAESRHSRRLASVRS